MCINFTNPQGNKCQWGFYCTHAHGQEDIRNPNKKSASNEQASQPQTTDKTENKDKTKDTSTKTTNNTSAQPISNMMTEIPPKMDKRMRAKVRNYGTVVVVVCSFFCDVILIYSY